MDKLPVLSKKILMDRWDEIVTDRSLNRDAVLSFLEDLTEPARLNGRQFVATTSGTTGLKGVSSPTSDPDSRSTTQPQPVPTTTRKMIGGPRRSPVPYPTLSIVIGGICPKDAALAARIAAPVGVTSSPGSS